jgi:hypothetical protein
MFRQLLVLAAATVALSSAFTIQNSTVHPLKSLWTHPVALSRGNVTITFDTFNAPVSDKFWATKAVLPQTFRIIVQGPLQNSSVGSTVTSNARVNELDKVASYLRAVIVACFIVLVGTTVL